MEHSSYKWGEKKHDRTVLSSVIYFLTKAAFQLAPETVCKIMREKGFAIKPYRLNKAQRELLSEAHSFYLEYRQNKIKVFEWGTGPTILLVHGWGGRALQLNSFVKPLVARGFRVVAFDHKGHGESSTRFSSYPEIVRGTDLLTLYYGKDLHGVIAHSIGSNSVFKVSEYFERKLKIVAVAPMENFPLWLEKMRRRVGIYEKLFARVIGKIEADAELNLLDQCVFNYDKIRRHEVLLVHDKLDRINKISASYEIQRNLKDTSLMETENLGHSRILGNKAVVDRVVAHFNFPV